MAEIQTGGFSPAEGNPALPARRKKPIHKRKWFKRAVSITVAAALAGGVWGYIAKKKADKAAAQNTTLTAAVQRGDIEVSLSSSGTVYPIEQYNIVPLVSGTILTSPYEEGDYVEKGAVLYTFDSSSSNAQIEKIQNQLARQQRELARLRENVENLTVRASSSGKIEGLKSLVGETANGQVCTITDTSVMYVDLGFNALQAQSINVGDPVTLGVEQYMITVAGTVSRKATAATTLSDGSKVYYVQIRIDSPGSISAGTVVTATVHTPSGDVSSPLSGKAEYPGTVTINAKQSGEVKEIRAYDGDWINKGEVIMVLENESLINSYNSAVLDIKDTQENLKSAQSDAEDYCLTAPISGVVLEKAYKAGDTVNSSNGSKTLMVVADLTKMYFTMDVDELDIASVKLGQTVEVTADAIEGTAFQGAITKLSQLGASSDGVTTYPVEVTISEPGELFPGMNVSAAVLVKSAYDTLYLPVDAVSYYNGKRYVNLVGGAASRPSGSGKTDDAKTPEPESKEKVPNSGADQPSGESGAQGQTRQRPNGGQTAAEGGSARGQWRQNGEGGQTGSRQRGEGGASTRQSSGSAKTQISAQDIQRVEVTVGISNEDYIEILSGLTEGQTVSYTPSTTGSGNTRMGMGGFGGGGMGGGGGFTVRTTGGGRPGGR